MRILAMLAFSFLFTTPVEAAEFCDNDLLVLEQSYTFDFSQGFHVEIPLPTIYGGVIRPGPLVLALESSENLLLGGSYAWPKKPGEAGFEHKPYRLQITIGNGADQQVIDQDYTNGCSNPPEGLFPGDHFDLIPLKLRAHQDGSPLGLEEVHLRYWGK